MFIAWKEKDYALQRSAMWRFKKHGTPPEPACRGNAESYKHLVPPGPNASVPPGPNASVPPGPKPRCLRDPSLGASGTRSLVTPGPNSSAAHYYPTTKCSPSVDGILPRMVNCVPPAQSELGIRSSWSHFSADPSLGTAASLCCRASLLV